MLSTIISKQLHATPKKKGKKPVVSSYGDHTYQTGRRRNWMYTANIYWREYNQSSKFRIANIHMQRKEKKKKKPK